MSTSRIAGALLLCFAAASPVVAQSTQPNFILINIDDLGYADIGPFGSDNKTPNLDRLAREGRKLTSHYAAPVCSPSRASLLTGCYPKRILPIPHVLFPASAVGLHPDEVTIAEILKQAGYSTACIGKWHLGDQPEFMPNNQGFDYYFGIPYSNDMGPASEGAKSNPGKPLPAPRSPGKGGVPEDSVGIRGGQPPLPLIENNKVVARVRADDQFQVTRQYTEHAVDYIKENKDKPFFLYMPHTAVHFPLYPSSSFLGKSPNGLIGDWAEEVDWSVGQIMETVRDLKLDKSTLVIFTSDNGGALNHGSNNQPLRGSKGQTYEGGIRVCTLAWWPGKIPAGTSTSAITSTMDILPTFAALGDGSLPKDRKIDGVDLWPVLAGDESQEPPRNEFLYYRGLNLQAVRSGPWKLHLTADDLAAAKNGKPSKMELYNLADDIGEKNNVAAAQPEIVQKLQALAQATASDLGLTDIGPGCRPLGTIKDPRPFIDHNGKVRADAVGAKSQFP